MKDSAADFAAEQNCSAKIIEVQSFRARYPLHEVMCVIHELHRATSIAYVVVVVFGMNIHRKCIIL